MQIYNYNGIKLRSINGWFVAKDVIKILNLSGGRWAIQRLARKDKSYIKIPDTLGRYQKMAIISRKGLYELLMRSNKQGALEFKKWVAQEILPFYNCDAGLQLCAKCKDKRPPLKTYFIKSGKYVRIGVTQDIAARLKTLQEGNPNKLTLLGYIDSAKVPDHFKKYLFCNKWYYLSTAIRKYIKENCI